jgi:pimeloyl-ACP methyl ester carboxylesterase
MEKLTTPTLKVILFISVVFLLGLPAFAQPAPITIGETFRMKSQRPGEEREIRVFLPSSYTNSKRSYPVIYALDGEGIGPVTANAVQFMSGYSTIPQMPEAIIVAVSNTDRNRDMPIPQAYGNGGEENFLAFLADELAPEVDRKYRTVKLRVLLGHSQGGLFAIYALATRPAVFQWYLSMDAPLAGFAEVKPIIEKARLAIAKTPMRLVSVESLYGWRKDWSPLVTGAPKGLLWGADRNQKRNPRDDGVRGNLRRTQRPFP